jgi:hypothetical protein
MRVISSNRSSGSSGVSSTPSPVSSVTIKEIIWSVFPSPAKRSRFSSMVDEGRGSGLTHLICKDTTALEYGLDEGADPSSEVGVVWFTLQLVVSTYVQTTLRRGHERPLPSS